ncbi:hypothetical protein B0I35DRAFT_445240 [Stachybotrys elegans]|uniref:Uncharacterized protein n=1 Tax=Stachybotrys elegans TaxID=80388 RepID=A0A8K0SF20_9HYPO|nr:hypothetical protein B0I35DRAFT_445240 [Stachybotrys elegans]
MARLMDEVDASRVPSKPHGIDTTQLLSQPFIQSTYAEVLRLYIATAFSGTVEYGDVRIGDYFIPRNSFLTSYSRTLALDYDAWTKRMWNHPLEEFNAEGFLVDDTWTRPGPSVQE